MVDMPYFMMNKNWYDYDYRKKKYILTDKAPERAKESYNKWIKETKDEVTDGRLKN